MAAIVGPGGPSMATKSAIDGPGGPVVAGDHLRRDRSSNHTQTPGIAAKNGAAEWLCALLLLV